jgi:hypothetical protein
MLFRLRTSPQYSLVNISNKIQKYIFDFATNKCYSFKRMNPWADKDIFKKSLISHCVQMLSICISSIKHEKSLKMKIWIVITSFICFMISWFNRGELDHNQLDVMIQYILGVYKKIGNIIITWSKFWWWNFASYFTFTFTHSSTFDFTFNDWYFFTFRSCSLLWLFLDNGLLFRKQLHRLRSHLDLSEDSVPQFCEE